MASRHESTTATPTSKVVTELTKGGGNAYSDLQPVLWGFAAVGTLLAMIQLMIYSVVARQHQRMVFVVWAGLLAVVGFAPLVSSVTTLLVGVAVVDSCLLAILLLSSLRQPEVEGPSQSASSA